MKFDHFTIRTPEPEIIRDFFITIIGLHDGPRPQFDFPGYWLYEKNHAVVHIVGDQEYNPPPDTGVFDHAAFEDNDENYADMINRLNDSEFDYRTRIVPGALRRQIFITGPHGVIIELNYPPEAPPP